MTSPWWYFATGVVAGLLIAVGFWWLCLPWMREHDDALKRGGRR